MRFALLTALAFISTAALGDNPVIRVDTRAPGKPVSRYLTGACIEDVNHEIYGGLYSQMIFGESFQEPAAASPVKHFNVVGGQWRVRDGEIQGEAEGGPKLISAAEPFGDGEAGVDVFLPGNAEGNGGLIVRVNRTAVGADQFDGYEIAVNANRRTVMLGRHEQNFRLLKEAPCEVLPDRWVHLSAKLSGPSIEVFVDGASALKFDDDKPLKAGEVGLRLWQRPARFKTLWIKRAGDRIELPFEADDATPAVSGMWTAVTTGTAKLQATIERDGPFTGPQSQRITFASGEGEAGVANEGLNHQAMAFARGKPYEGYLWARAEKPTTVSVSLEDRQGNHRLAEQSIALGGEGWRRYDFTLTPREEERAGRFAIRLTATGSSVTLGHAFLQPGAWGRFKDLPVRHDVVEGLIDLGVTVLRYGGSMVNESEYRWKKMIGPRDRRPPYKGHWYPYSSNGWGIPDFLNLCEAAGFLAIPDLDVNESPQDIADFIAYANGPADGDWGRRRAADGHAKPYGLKYLELGNEEAVNDDYVAKFTKLAEAIWAKDPAITLVVGDFAYARPITDPMKITGADSHITSLAGQQRILQLAKAHDREVWFDVHVDTDKAEPSATLRALPTYVDALDALAAGARHKVVVFELNANNARQRRALGNAVAIGTATRDGRLPIVTSANGLQPDGQNDNGWDQGLLFLNPSKVWLQPPGYVTRMISRSYEPIACPVSVTPGDDLDVTAVRDESAGVLVLRVVNLAAQPREVELALDGYAAKAPTAAVEELAGPRDAVNTAASSDQIKPTTRAWTHGLTNGRTTLKLAGNSFSVIRFE